VDDLELGYLMAVAGALVWSPRTLRAWLRVLGNPRALAAWAREHAGRPPDSTPALAPVALARLAAVDDDGAHRALEALERSGARALVPDDSDYPNALRDLDDAPPVLYVRGDPHAAGGRAAAIVGSRAATSYGRALAASFAADFVSCGACVISGLARGIDAAAHKGALAARGKTVGVVGSGVNALYPPYHALLADDIVAAGGALLSEFPPDMPAQPFHFPMRNRLVAALSGITIVVEAGRRSGALITARLADELGRHVFAVPGDVGRATSAGTNALIKDGVPLVESGIEAAQLAGWASIVPSSSSAAAPSADDPLLAHLDVVGTDIESLSARSGIDMPALLAQLTLLEIRGVIVRQPGGRYAAVIARRATNGSGDASRRHRGR